VTEETLGILGEYESASSASSSDSSISSTSSQSDSDTGSELDSDETPGVAIVEDDNIILNKPAPTIELPALPLETEAVTNEVIKVDIDKPKICKFFAKSGRCRAGQKCMFAHTVRFLLSSVV
jgi:hypothetical protein